MTKTHRHNLPRNCEEPHSPRRIIRRNSHEDLIPAKNSIRRNVAFPRLRVLLLSRTDLSAATRQNSQEGHIWARPPSPFFPYTQGLVFAHAHPPGVPALHPRPRPRDVFGRPMETLVWGKDTRSRIDSIPFSVLVPLPFSYISWWEYLVFFSLFLGFLLNWNIK